jgi:hypothetical protein
MGPIVMFFSLLERTGVPQNRRDIPRRATRRAFRRHPALDAEAGGRS